MRFGSLFTGVGGFDLGLERAGMQCAWQVEIDENCNKVLERHWKDVRRFKDVREVGRNSLEPVDLICGGFPCQDLSVAGKRNGLSGERSGLWFEFKRIVTEMQPKWVVVENVPGLFTSDGGNDFRVILESLDELRYGVSWRVLDSKYWGVPQRRRRVFIVGSYGDLSSAKVLFESEGVSGNITKSKEGRKRTATATQGDTDINCQSVGALDSECGGAKLTLQSLMSGHFVPAYWDGGQTSDTLDVSMLGKGQMMPEKRRMPAVIDTNPHKSAGMRIQVNAETSVTLQGEGGGMAAKTGLYYYPQIGVRRLTPVECCRLQGFPDDWNDNVSETQRYRQMGNAVTVNVIEWIGKRISKIEERKD